MGHYKSNVRDIEFNLFEVLGTDALLGTPPFTDIDQDTARGIIAEVARLAEGPVGESFADGDRNPPIFDPEYPLGHPAGVDQALLPGAAASRVLAPGDEPGAGWAGRSADGRVGASPSRFSVPIRPCTCTWPAHPSLRFCTRSGTSRSAGSPNS